MAERAASRDGARRPGRDRLRRLDWPAVVPLFAGLAAVAAAMAAGGSGDLLAMLARPPELVRAALAGLSIVAGAVLLRNAVLGIAATTDLPAASDLRTMVRGVRSIFLAAAAFSAAGGWILGHPLPIVVGLVIAEVDVVETSLLLLVAEARGTPRESDPCPG